MRNKLNKMHDEEILCSFAKGTWEPKRKAIRLALELPVYRTLEICEDCAERFRRMR